MSQDNLTTQYVSDTYQRLLQLSDNGDYITDGTGSKVNILPVTASWAEYVVNGSGGPETDPIFTAKSASLATTGSNQFSGNQTITGSIILSGSTTDAYISTVNWIDFNSNIPAGSPAFNTGRLHWVDDTKTLGLDTDVNGSTIELGHQHVVRVVNQTGVTISQGRVVYISGSQGTRPGIATASYTDENDSATTLGFVMHDIVGSGGNTNGYVVTRGMLRGVNTFGLPAGASLYLSSSGQYSNTKPQAPLHDVRLGKVIVGESTNAGVIYVDIQNGYEIDELHNVRIIGDTTGDLIIKSGSLWINSKTLSGSYTLSGSLTTNDGVSVQTLTASFISASSITGSLFGIASSASLVRVSSSNFTNNTFSLTFVPYSANMDDYRLIQTDNSLLYNPNTNLLSLTNATANSITANSFIGTASWATQAVTASFLLGSVTSASYALTSSFAVSASWAANGVPGGSNRQIQFNNSGIFGGESNLTYNKGGSANNFSTVRLINGSPNPDPDTEATEAGLRLEDSSNQGWTHTFSAVVNCPDTASTTVFSLETSGAQPTLGATCTYTIVDVNDYSSIRTGQLYVSFVGDGSTYYLSDTNNFGGNRADPNSAIFVLDYNGTLGRVRLQNDSSVTLRVVINVTTFTIK